MGLHRQKDFISTDMGISSNNFKTCWSDGCVGTCLDGFLISARTLVLHCCDARRLGTFRNKKLFGSNASLFPSDKSRLLTEKHMMC